MVKAKLRSGKDKGGCLVGKKEKTTKGGCKVGRKGVNYKGKAPAKAKAPAKPKAKAPAKPKAKAPAKAKPKPKPKFTLQENIEMAERANTDRRKKEKMDRIKRKVAILNRKEVALNKKKARQTANTAKKLTEAKAKKAETKARIQGKVAKLGKMKASDRRLAGRRLEYEAKKLKAGKPAKAVSRESSAEEVEVEEVFHNGKRYFKDDRGQYYDPSTEEEIADPTKTKAKAPAKPKKEKIIYPTKVHNIRGEQYAVHKGKIYKYDKYSGERGGQINIAGADIKDKSVIDTIKNLSNPKAPAIPKAKGKAKAEPTKVLSSVKLGGKGMDLPDLYKHGMGNASKIELGNMLDKMGKDINAEIKKMKTADRAYFKVVKVRGGTEYHTEAANIMNQEQQEVQKALERYVKTHGIRDPGVQEMIGKFNRQAKSAVNRMRKAKGAALERLGFI